MRMRHIVFAELKRGKARLITSVLVVLLPAAIVVFLQTLSDASEKALAAQLRKLGANVFVVPRGMSIADFHAAAFGDAQMPETYLYKVAGVGLAPPGDIRGMLCRKLHLDGHPALLTGVVDANGDTPVERGLALGSDIAAALGKRAGDRLVLSGQSFGIAQVLPAEGTLDDNRIYADLSTVQTLLRQGRAINVIEIVVPGDGDPSRVGERLETMFPDVKALTRRGLSRSKANLRLTLGKYSLLLLMVVLIVGAVNVANQMGINVRERRREIGTLLAIGATPGMVLRVFIEKAILLGLFGGMAGCLLGATLAILVGPMITHAPVGLHLQAWAPALGLAIAFSVAASAIPAHRAASLDPAVILGEE